MSRGAMTLLHRSVDAITSDIARRLDLVDETERTVKALQSDEEDARAEYRKGAAAAKGAGDQPPSRQPPRR